MSKPCKRCGSTERYKYGHCTPCGREYSRRWRKNNPEKVREQSRASSRKYAVNNLEKVKESCRQWKDKNPEKQRANSNRRRSRKNKVISQPYDFETICTQYGNKCLRCGRDDVKLTVDHIIPISWGGNDTADNIQPLCLSCNAGKGNHRATDYRPENRPSMYIQLPLFEAKPAEANA